MGWFMRDVAMFLVPICLYGSIWILMDIFADNLYIKVISDKTVPAGYNVVRVRRIRGWHITAQIVLFFIVLAFVPPVVENIF